jgi:GT2 family glycosyltransferase/glycosyltransferase involved in cell wall biosynthesis
LEKKRGGEKSKRPGKAEEASLGFRIRRGGSCFMQNKNNQTKVCIIVPLYKNKDLFLRLAHSLLDTQNDWAPFVSKFVFINDSPDDVGLFEAMANFPWGEFGVECLRVSNSKNLGFVGSVNKGLRLAQTSGDHALILNSDTVVFGTWLSGMLEVLDEDEKISFVSPRSNNATISNYPQGPGIYEGLTPEEAFQLFQERYKGLPKFTFVPIAVGFCLLIRSWVLKDLGVLDEIYGLGYNEENDLILRANRYGLVSATANWVFVFHDGEASFSQAPVGKSKLDEKNQKILHSRYPEFRTALERFYSGPRYLTEFVWGETGGIKPRLTFDLTNLHDFENGTTKLSRSLFTHFSRLFGEKYNVILYVSKSTSKYHSLTDLAVDIVDSDTESIPYSDVIVRVGQVFTVDWILSLRQRTRILSVFMLDPIAWDTHETSVDFDPKSWHATFVLADQVPSISQFSQKAFSNRFIQFKNLDSFQALPSLATRDYLIDPRPVSLDQNYVLVIGNKFRHKFVSETVNALSGVSDYPIYAIGGSKNITGASKAFVSGKLSSDEMQSLIVNAQAVVFPSLYEGFGFPLIEGVVNSRRVFARDMSVNREISERLGNPKRLRLYHTTEDLANEIRNLNVLTPSEEQPVENEHSWEEAVTQLERALATALSRMSFERLEERLTLAWLIGLRNHVGDPVTQLFTRAELQVRSLLKIRWVFWIARKSLGGFRMLRRKPQTPKEP